MLDRRAKLLDWAPGLLMLAMVFVATLTVQSAPRQGGAVAAVFPPWWSASRAAVAASGAGRIVAGGGAPFIVALKSDSPGLAARVRAQGAWLVLDHDLRGLCAHSGNTSQ